MLDRLILKENEIFAVTDKEGNIRAPAADGQGLYFGDTRFLSVYEFSIDDVPFQLLASAGELNFMSNFQFGNQPTTLPDGTRLRARTLSIRRNRFIDNGLHERIGLMNYGRVPVTVTLRLSFGSDFRDMFDVRGYAKRVQRGVVGTPEIGDNRVRLRYLGLDAVPRITDIQFDLTPASVELQNVDALSVEGLDQPPQPRGDPRIETGALPPTAEVAFTATLVPNQSWSLTIHVVPIQGAEPAPSHPYPSLDDSFGRILHEHSLWEDSCTRITTDNELLNALIRQSVHDLRLTINQLPSGLLPMAGIPWFAVPFGRDSLITSLQTLCLNPDIAYGTLRFLARHQGKAIDPWRDEEPGKILHEIRSGEMATLREVPQTPYYGSVDSTPLFVYVFTELLRWTDDWVLAADLRPHLEQALEWVRVYGDRDGDGLVEYESRSTRGIHNQGWKDSFDSITLPDGQLARAPIAVAEVQGYAYGAEARMADVYRRWGEAARADFYDRSAAHRKARFEEMFWLEAEQFYAEALDADKTPVPAVTSNPAHCLLMGMIDGARAERLATRLMQDDMLSGWGIRTLSSAYCSFNPMSYHNGSIWPHDNSIVAAGLRRSGHAAAALQVIEQVLEAGFRLPGYRLPELYCGFGRDRRYHSLPAAYPVSCTPQAWAAGAVFLMLQHLIGLEPDLPNGRIVLRPLLLPWLNQLRFEHLRLGHRNLSISVWRAGADVRCEVQGAEDLDVVIEPAAGPGA